MWNKDYLINGRGSGVVQALLWPLGINHVSPLAKLSELIFLFVWWGP